MPGEVGLSELFRDLNELCKQRPTVSVEEILRDQPELLAQLKSQLVALEPKTPASPAPEAVLPEPAPAQGPPATAEGAPPAAPAAPPPEIAARIASQIGGRFIRNSIDLKLNLIPAGEFWMGSPGTDWDSRADEKPRHQVKITKRFYLGVYQVTIGQFRTFVTEAQYATEAERAGGGWGLNDETLRFEGHGRFTWRFVGWEQSDEHPVVNVSWNDAQAFCSWLSRREGMTYRLPTEAEWEYACRAGTQTRFYGMNREAEVEVFANTADESMRQIIGEAQSTRSYRTGTDNFPFAAPVGRFRNNAFGLYDMHGNVWEWCSDWYDRDYYKNSPQEDPSGPPTGVHRVLRGGSWNDLPAAARSASRNSVPPHARDQVIGFRVVLDVGGK